MIDMPSKEDLMEIFAENKSLSTVAEFYDVSLTTVVKWQKHYKLSRSRLKPVPTKEEIEVLVNKGMSQREIGKHLNLYQFTVLNYMKKYEIEPNPQHKKMDIDIEEMKKLRETGDWTFVELAELYKTSATTIQHKCKEYGVKKVKVDIAHNDWNIASNKTSLRSILR